MTTGATHTTRVGRTARVVALVLGVAFSVLATVQSAHKIQKGHNALLKWKPDVERFGRGEPVYGVGDEGFPTPPVTLLVVRAFLRLGDLAGPMSWALLKLALAWWIVWTALDLAAGSPARYPPVGLVVVVLLSVRPLLSDILHGNVNIVVGATVVLAAVCWSRGRPLLSGLAVGLGAALKVTPALFVVYYAWKRSARGLLGVAIGIALFAFLLPALVVGFEANGVLLGQWWQQMIAPYVAGREVTLLQSEHINQSLLGVSARLLTDAVAISAHPPEVPEDVRVSLVTLAPGTFLLVHRALCLAVVAFLLFCCRGASVRDKNRTLGEFAMGALAMLFLSERSWKHHYVLVALPLAYLVWHAATRRDRGAAIAVALAAVLFGLTGSAVLGDHASNLAEAYGVYLAGGLALFVACGRTLRATSPEKGHA